MVPQFIKANWAAYIIGGFLLGFVIDFLLRFWWKSRGIGKDLDQCIEALEMSNGAGHGEITNLDDLAKTAMTTRALTHLWGEYRKTLHPQRATDETGRARVVRWRATTLAETFFTEQALVDSPLSTDYFKHLPGILTGIGIIGTFSGLIPGLLAFSSANLLNAEVALHNLLSTVGHAFYMSAAAIFLAMVFTVLEKLIIATLYRKVEGLQQRINKLFAVGAGDEYLEQIAKAAQTSANQALVIKDALVGELKEILFEVTKQQVAASDSNSARISSDVGRAIGESLRHPLERITDAVERVGSNQGEAVSKLLVDVLASFAGQMREMFGGQMAGIGDLLRTTNDAMQMTAGRFEQLAANMDNAGKSAADAMAGRLTDAVTAMEARQQMLNRQMGEFVDQIRSMVAQSQTEASQKLQETLATLGEQVGSVVAQLHAQVESSADRQEQHAGRFSRETATAIGSISREVEHLMAQSVQTNQALQATVAQLSMATKDSIGKMNSGAEMLLVASGDFAKAGTGVVDSIRLSNEAVSKIQQVSQSLVAASNTTQQVSNEYARSRDVFAVMIGDLKLTVENARREASMTSGVLQNLRLASEQLSAAEKQAEEYLKKINEVLEKTHREFAEKVGQTLGKSNADFQQQLQTAVSLLASGITDLGATLEGASSLR